MKKKSQPTKIIEEIERLLTELRVILDLKKIPSRNGEKFEPTNNRRGKFSGLTGKIYDLTEEGFFKEPKTISEVQKKLKDEGVNKPTTSLMPSLIRLVSNKVLGRNKPDRGLYKYYQR